MRKCFARSEYNMSLKICNMLEQMNKYLPILVKNKIMIKVFCEEEKQISEILSF